MKKKGMRVCAVLLAILLCGIWTPVMAKEETIMIHVDSVNGTRWADTLVVYRDRETTEQNEWGENVIVDASGKVTEKIPGGDLRGKNLAIPKGGMVISGTGDKGKSMYARLEVGYHVVFDEYGSRILASRGEIDPFYEWSIHVTNYNAPRYSKTVVIYDRAGTRTETNGYGYEVTVDRDGYIISAGGNDSLVPEGGYVLSVIEAEDREQVKTYFIMGARCALQNDTVTVTYDESMLVNTVQNELAALKQQLQEAKEQLRLIDYQQIDTLIAEAESQTVSTLAERDAVLEQIKSIGRQMIERRTVEIRSSWYSPLEKNAEEVRETVAEMCAAGLNQVCIGVDPEMLKLSKEFPYAPNKRVASFDLLGAYVDACKEAGLELFVSVPIFYHNDPYYKKWLTKTNGQKAEPGAGANEEIGTATEPETFCSPANEEFINFIKEYLTYLVTRYDIDGFQYDYIRFPYFDGVTDYGYDDAMKDLYAAETGFDRSEVDEIGKQLSAHPHWDEWIDFKTELITRRVSEISAIIREVRPDLYITAAVADVITRSAYCQDSSVWLEKGYVDGIYPMSYAEGIMQPSTVKFRDFIGDSDFLVMGNGAYLSLTLEEMYRQTRDSALYGSDGIAYFEWGAYRSHGYASSLAAELFASPALSFTAAEQESIAALLKTAESRFALYDSLNGKQEQAVYTALAEQNPDDAAALYQALQALYPKQEALLQDVELAARIQRFSRAQYKGTANLLPVTVDQSEPSESKETSAESDPISVGSETPEKTSAGLILGIVAGAVVLVGAAAACVLFRKRRK